MKKTVFLGVLALLFLISLNNAFALTESISFNIVSGKSVTEHIIDFDSALTGDYTLKIPRDAKAISVYSDNKLISEQKEGERIFVILENTKQLKISYVSSFYLDKSNFLFSYKAQEDLVLKLKVVLPSKAVLKEKTGAAIPEPTGILSDGQSIILFWEKDLAAQDELAVFVRFVEQKNYPAYFALILLITSAVFWYALARKPKEKIVEKVVVKTEGIEEHLKEDEEQVVSVLKKRDGSCEQGTLRVITGIPKATLSRILMELEDRRVIFKEKRGKKNIIFLK